MTSLFTLSNCWAARYTGKHMSWIAFHRRWLCLFGDVRRTQASGWNLSYRTRLRDYWRRARARLFYRSRSPLNWRISFPLSARQDCGRGYYSFFPRKQHESDTNGTTIGYRLAEWFTSNLKNTKFMKTDISIAFRSLFVTIFLKLINS